MYRELTLMGLFGRGYNRVFLEDEINHIRSAYYKMRWIWREAPPDSHPQHLGSLSLFLQRFVLTRIHILSCKEKNPNPTLHLKHGGQLHTHTHTLQ